MVEKETGSSWSPTQIPSAFRCSPLASSLTSNTTPVVLSRQPGAFERLREPLPCQRWGRWSLRRARAREQQRQRQTPSRAYIDHDYLMTVFLHASSTDLSSNSASPQWRTSCAARMCLATRNANGPYCSRVAAASGTGTGTAQVPLRRCRPLLDGALVCCAGGSSRTPPTARIHGARACAMLPTGPYVQRQRIQRQRKHLATLHMATGRTGRPDSRPRERISWRGPGRGLAQVPGGRPSAGVVRRWK
jgi:hypothetical protein